MWNPFKKKNSSAPWIVSTFLLIILFAIVLLYTYNPFGWNFGDKNGTKKELTFKVPITIIYNTKVPEQKGRIEVFVNSLVNPDKGLKSTTLEEKWLDSGSNEAKTFLEEGQAKYLPVALLNEDIENHPQFNSISSYLEKKGNHYYFHLYPLEHLSTPPVTGGMVKGDLTKAKITIIEYSSFTCSFCKQMVEVMNKVMKDFPDQIALVYKVFDRGAYDSLVAQGALCAADQNKFWEMHDKLFANQEKLVKLLTPADGKQLPSVEARDKIVTDYLNSQAKALKLNSVDFGNCLSSGIHKKDVENSTIEAGDYGISGTPAFFINNKFADGAYDYNEFKALITDQIQ